MFFADHGQPHFHAQYAEFKAIISIIIIGDRRNFTMKSSRVSFGLGRVASKRTSCLQACMLEKRDTKKNRTLEVIYVLGCC